MITVAALALFCQPFSALAEPAQANLPDLTDIDTDQFLPSGANMPSCEGMTWHALRMNLAKNVIRGGTVSSGMNYFGAKDLKDPIEEKEKNLKAIGQMVWKEIHDWQEMRDKLSLKEDERDAIVNELHGRISSHIRRKLLEQDLPNFKREIAYLEKRLADEAGHQKQVANLNENIDRLKKRIDDLKALPQAKYRETTIIGSQEVGGIAVVTWMPEPEQKLKDIERIDRLFKNPQSLPIGERGIRASKGAYNIRFIRGPYIVSLWMASQVEMDLTACGDAIARLIDSRLQAGVDVMILSAELVQSIEGAMFIGNRDTGVRVVLDLVGPKPEVQATVTVKVNGHVAATRIVPVKPYKNYTKDDKKLLKDSVNLVIPAGFLPTGQHKVTVEVATKDEPKGNLKNNTIAFSPFDWYRPHGLRLLFVRTHDTISMKALDALAQKAKKHLENVYPVSGVQVVTDPQTVRTWVDIMYTKVNETANILNRYNLKNPHAPADFAVGVFPKGKYGDPSGVQINILGMGRAVLVSDFETVSHEIGHFLGLEDEYNKAIGIWIDNKIAFDRHNKPSITTKGLVPKEQGFFGIGKGFVKRGYSFMGNAGAHPKHFYTWVRAWSFDFLYTLMSFNKGKYYKKWAMSGPSPPPASHAVPPAGTGMSAPPTAGLATSVVSLARGKSLTVFDTGGRKTTFMDATQTATLMAGQTVKVEKGIIGISLPGGAQVSAPAGTVFEIKSPTEVSVKKGTLAVRGKLTIQTPAGKLVPEGTFFAARVAADGTTYVDVISGAVRAEMSSSTHTINAGETATLSPTDGLTDTGPLDEAALLAAMSIREAPPETAPAVAEPRTQSETPQPMAPVTPPHVGFSHDGPMGTTAHDEPEVGMGGDGVGEDEAAGQELSIKTDGVEPALTPKAAKRKKGPKSDVTLKTYVLIGQGRVTGQYDRATEKVYVEAVFDIGGRSAFFIIRVQDRGRGSYMFEIPIYTEGLGKVHVYELPRPISGWTPGTYEATAYDSGGNAVSKHKFEILDN